MKTVLCDREDANKVIEQMRIEWLHEVLPAFNVPKTIFDEDFGGNEARNMLIALDLEVWQNSDGTVDIYRKKKLVAQWKQPTMTLIKDNKGFYYEIKINEWALPFQMKRGEI
jgi:hypothetical protein